METRPHVPGDDGALVEGRSAALIAELETLAQHARAFAEDARADRTKHEYAAQWRAFEAWCATRGLRALPCEPATLALYLTDRAMKGLKPSSLSVAIAAVIWHHAQAGISEMDQPHLHPQVAVIWRGIRRRKGTAPRRVAPCVVSELRAMVERLDDTTLIGQRDRALLVVGFAGALRRSELVALVHDDVQVTATGLVITIRRSKTDQEAAGTTVGLPFGSDPQTCPVRTLRAWLVASAIETGPLFRGVNRHGQLRAALSGRDVARIIKLAAERAGLDARRYSGHSLRSGLATSAAMSGKTDRAIMSQGRWVGRAMVDRYVRNANLLDESNAARGIGL